VGGGPAGLLRDWGQTLVTALCSEAITGECKLVVANYLPCAHGRVPLALPLARNRRR
jgi:hypothetical protein